MLGSLRNAALVACLALASASGAFGATPVPSGVWVWDTGDAAVEFHACGEALCGRIVWLKKESAGGGPVLDSHNPDASLQSRRVCGIDYITGLKKTASGDWKHGRVYDFSSGKSYDLDVDSVEAGAVRMRGYQGMRLLGANLVLVRPTGPIASCVGEK